MIPTDDIVADSFKVVIEVHLELRKRSVAYQIFLGVIE